MQEAIGDVVPSPGGEDPLAHSSILCLGNPMDGGAGGLLSMGSQSQTGLSKNTCILSAQHLPTAPWTSWPARGALNPFPPLMLSSTLPTSLPRLLPAPLLSAPSPPLFLSHILCTLSLSLYPGLSLKKKKKSIHRAIRFANERAGNGEQREPEPKREQV